MVRTRQFDPDKTLYKIMMLFWTYGYQSLSMDQLVRESGVNRYSLYQAFGNKEAIFNQALTLYADIVFRHMLEPLTSQQGKEAVLAYFAQFKSKLQDPRAANGCLIFNSLDARLPIEQETRNTVEQALKEQRQLLLIRLQEAIEDGSITAHEDAKALAYFLSSQLRLVLGIRRDNGAEEMTTFCNVLLKDIDSW